MSEVINEQFNIGLKLKAEGDQEQRVLDYLTKNASSFLVAKINDGKKTLKGALQYCNDEARKLVDSGAKFAMVDDKTVYGWIIHYFEDDSIKASIKSKRKSKSATVVKPEPVKPKKSNLVNLELFDEFKDGGPF